jgi:hypothetical protein
MRFGELHNVVWASPRLGRLPYLHQQTSSTPIHSSASCHRVSVELRNTRNEQIFSALPPITHILGGRLECFHSIQYSANAPWRAPCPRLSRLTRFCDLLAGWKLDSFVLIRCRHEIPFAYERPLCARSGHSREVSFAHLGHQAAECRCSTRTRHPLKRINRGASFIRNSTAPSGVSPRPSAAKSQVQQIQTSPAMTRCRFASVPLDCA